MKHTNIFGQLSGQLSIVVVALFLFAVTAMTAFGAAIPDALLQQKMNENFTFNQQGTIYGILSGPSFETKLVDWRLSAEDEAKSIADHFITNSEADLGMSLSDLKFTEVLLTSQADIDYHNPSAAVRYVQYYHDIPVYDSRVQIDINAYGTVVGRMDMHFISDITAPATPKITSEEAIQLAKDHYSKEALDLEKDPELYVYSADKLVYRLNIMGDVGKELFLDADNGDIVLERQNWVDQASGEPGSETTTPDTDSSPVPTLYDTADGNGADDRAGGQVDAATRSPGAEALDTAGPMQVDISKGTENGGFKWIYVLVPIAGLIVLAVILLAIRKKE